jgi:hypothetical protein
MSANHFPLAEIAFFFSGHAEEIEYRLGMLADTRCGTRGGPVAAMDPHRTSNIGAKLALACGEMFHRVIGLNLCGRQ